tara:strand:- start:2086 stop:3264 length:1179 start_codon:yes stop_codon:yes gene_type:complete
MGDVNNADISDNRIDFTTFINRLTQTQEQTNSEGTLILPILDTTNDRTLIDSFNITNFKTDFNTLLDKFKNDKYHIDDIFRRLYFHDKLSKTIKKLIYYSIRHDAYLNDHSTSEKNKRINFFNWFNNNYYENDNIKKIGSNTINDISNDTVNNSLLLNLINNEYFTLYNKIIEIENLEVEGEKQIIKELSILVTKYFFLTEILLKMLLDTQYNNNGGDNTIINNFRNVPGEKGLGELHNYNSAVVDINSCDNNNNPSEQIRSKMKNVIIKGIYNILNEVTEKLEDMQEQSLEYNIDVNSEIIKMNNRIKNLNSDKKSFIHYDRTIKNKKDHVKKNNMKNRRNFIIILVLAIILIISNLYTFIVSKKNTSIIFQINISIIVVIILIKFYYLFK